jgi:hypothetical protein
VVEQDDKRPRSVPQSLSSAYDHWIAHNHIKISVERGCTVREVVERVAAGAFKKIPIQSLSSVLDQKRLIRGSTVFGTPADFFNEIAHSFNLNWWITGSGLTMAEKPPQGVSYADANGVLMSEKHKPIQLRASRTIRSRFPKRARWLDRELKKRGWSTLDIERHDGPQHQTVEKILRGGHVRADVLKRLADSLSQTGDRISPEDIPDN